MIHPAGGPDPAAPDSDTLRFLHDLRLSDETISHFQLGTTYHRTGGASSPSRLHIPLHGNSATILAGSASRALHDSARCRKCGETITATEIASRMSRHRFTQERERPGDCPRCGASKKKANVSWLVSQYPKYLTDGGADRHGKFLYNFHRACWALDPEADWDADDLGRMLIICESFTDTWAIHEAGYGAVVSWTGARPTGRQLDDAVHLARLDRDHGDGSTPTLPIMVFAQSDEAGWINAERAARELRLRSNGQIVVFATDEEDQDAAGYLRRHGARALGRFIRDARVADA